MPSIPKLPAALVGALGVVASVLAIVQPTLPDPWPAVVGGVLALLTVLGVPVTVRAVRAHGEASAQATLTDYGSGAPGTPDRDSR